MGANFHEVYARKEAPLPSDRSTGLVFVGIALVVAYFWRSNSLVLTSALFLAAVLLGLSLLAPSVLRPLNVAWMRLALLLSKVVNPIVMAVLFVVAIVPTGLLMQCKRDPLRKQKTNEASYWRIVDKSGQQDTSSLKNQF